MRSFSSKGKFDETIETVFPIRDVVVWFAARVHRFSEQPGVARVSVGRPGKVQTGEFDPGSERTLAACLRHASRTVRPLRGYTSGARVSNAWAIYRRDRDNSGKLELIPDKTTRSSDFAEKGGLFLKAIAC